MTDPIFAAIDLYRELHKKVHPLYLQLDAAEAELREKFGRRPDGLIRWRNWLIGGSEIARTRDILIQQGEDKKTINKEYRDAEKRYADQLRAAADWDKRSGLKPMRDEYERTFAAADRALSRLVATKPETPRGAAALASWIAKDMAIGDRPEQQKAARTLARALGAMQAAA